MIVSSTPVSAALSLHQDSILAGHHRAAAQNSEITKAASPSFHGVSFIGLLDARVPQSFASDEREAGTLACR